MCGGARVLFVAQLNRGVAVVAEMVVFVVFVVVIFYLWLAERYYGNILAQLDGRYHVSGLEYRAGLIFSGSTL